MDDDAEKHPIPLFYRIVLLYIEPLFALNGAFLCLASPSHFLDAVSPHHPVANTASIVALAAPSSLSHSSSSSSSSSNGDDTLRNVRILTDMLGIMQLVFAFNLAVTLRVAGTQTKIWRVMCAGMLLSDLLHIAVSVREYGAGGVGGQGVGVGAWRLTDWINFGILVGMGVVRLGAVLGIGIHERRERKDHKSKIS
ncbi:uncharacterized protein J7T54_002060 [Emericellopsis cladophorae]|uniref:DUF7704 domain-containing protein n=1 Tax=Emericellopsis cladophorae TaxID=2686198 RepID=A0A9Q0BFH3_9HYPO|nr:uncharacterized protein J7T54_002060 [Emericellopsis cladophorae]KAI6782901.1 hypothetical protein J7T54_002060 [Emericellopsis cladophorae]